MKSKTPTINASVTPQLEAWVAEQVASGWYNNSSEVVREALRLLRDHQEVRAAKLRDLRNAIDEGMNSSAAVWEGAEAIKHRARQRHAARTTQPVTED